MGGKNVYYLLTPLERGRLQVLPLAYDVHKKAWYDMAASGVRHFPDRRDEALDWTDRMFAFNTTCFNCHVTELATNYDLATDTYHTTWAEPGIGCESCHGSAKEHIRVMNARATGDTSKDIKIIRTKEFTPAQMNDMCATCHAKLVPLSQTFLPGERFFDHFDLTTLEHADYYPDGRDLGENYTFTSWLMSPCLKSGKLDCNHCHTPSGRLRFEGEKSNQMCLPCHQKEVSKPAEHGHHAAGSKGNECIACHMPMTRFAAMGRTDHSMRRPRRPQPSPSSRPTPAACVTPITTPPGPTNGRGNGIGATSRPRCSAGPNSLTWPASGSGSACPRCSPTCKSKGDEVYRTSLVRLLAGCEDPRKWPVLLGLLEDPSPLVRSSAAAALGGHLTPAVVQALLAAAADTSRLVRIRTAMSLAALPPERVTDERKRQTSSRRIAEFITAMQARPDDWSSHANLGNFYMDGRDFAAAAACFETASRLEPRQVGPMVNASMAYSNLHENDKAEQCLRQALKMDPDQCGRPTSILACCWPNRGTCRRPSRRCELP